MKTKDIVKNLDVISKQGFFKELMSMSGKVSSMRFVFIVGIFITIVGSIGMCFYSIHKDGGTAVLSVAAYATAILTPLCAGKAYQQKNEAKTEAPTEEVK